MAERAAGFPQPSHGACESGRADSCRHGCRRAGAVLCRHGMSRDGRTPTGRPEGRRCRHLRDRPRPVGLGDAGSRGTASRLSRPPSRPRSPTTGRGLGRVPGNGCALVRRLPVEGAWVLARGNPACRKRGGASVPLACVLSSCFEQISHRNLSMNRTGIGQAMPDFGVASVTSRRCPRMVGLRPAAGPR